MLATKAFSALRVCVLLHLAVWHAADAQAVDISAVEISNLPASGGLTITVRGGTFGTSDPSPTVYIGGQNAVQCTSKWVTETLILCTPSDLKSLSALGSNLADGGWSGIDVVGIIGGGFANTEQDLLTFDAPIVTYLMNINAPSSGNSAVTLFGTNFGSVDYSFSKSGDPAQNKNWIMLGTTNCASSQWVTETSVICRTPYGANPLAAQGSAGWGVQVTVGAVVGTRNSGFSFDAPVLSTSVRINSPSTAANTLTLLGINFMANDFTPTATFYDVNENELSIGTTTWSTSTTVIAHRGYLVDKSGVKLSARLTVTAIVGTKQRFYTFDAPSASASIPQWSNVVGSQSTSVTISGLNFGGYQRTPTVSLDDTQCGTTSWSSSTTVSCESAGGGGRSLKAIVTVATVIGTSANFFSFDAPTVSFQLNPSFNVGLCGANTVTISGLNFGYTSFTPTARFGATQCGTTAWTAATTLTCLSPAGIASSATSKSLSLTVSSHIGTSAQFFSFDAPVVSFLALENGPTIQTAHSVTITGMAFGYGENYTPSIRLGPTLCSSTQFVSDTSIHCQPGAMLGGGGFSSLVTIAAVVGTKVAAFTFDQPLITEAVITNAAVTAGGSLTLSGANFGILDATPTAVIFPSPAEVCASTSWTSYTTTMCIVPNTAGGSKKALAVTVMAIVGTRISPGFSYDAPVVSYSPSANLSPSGGATVTLNGLNFGGLVATSTAQVADVTCSTTSWSSTSSVLCYGDVGIYHTGSATKLTGLVTVSAVVGTRPKSFTFDAPMMSSFLQSTNTALSGGQTVTISGLNFGYIAATPSMALDDTLCGTTSWSSTTTVSCQTGAGAGSVGMRLTVSSVVSTAYSSMTFDAPVVSYQDVTNMPTYLVTSFTISGMNFGTENYTPTTGLGSSSCNTVTWTSDTYLTCGSAHYGVGAKRELKVTVGAAVGTSKAWFTFDAPVMTAFSPSNMAQAFYYSVTLLGVNFGAEDATASIEFRGPSATAMCTTTSWTTDSSLVCFSNAQGFGTPTTHVHVAAVVGTRHKIFTFDAAVPTHLHPPNSPTTSDGTITLSGMNFASADYTPTAAVGDTLCRSAAWTSMTTVGCQVMPGIGAKVRTILTVGGIVSTKLHTFSYNSPVLTWGAESTSSMNMASSSATSVTIAGLNFGATACTPSIRIYAADACTTSSWTSSTTVSCNNPAGYGASRTIAITASLVVGTVMGLFSFDSPIISYFLAQNAAISGGTSVTLSGMSFATSSPTLTASLGSTVCATSYWTSLTQVLCSTPAGRETTNLIAALTVATMVGTNAMRFSFDAPVLTRANIYNGPSTGGLSITLNGFNFGSSDLSGTVRLSKNNCASLIWQAATSLICQASYGKSTERGKFSLTMASAVGTSGYLFSFDGPTITYFGPYNSANSGSQSILIQGHNFEAVDLTPSIALGDTTCGTVSWTTTTSLSCASSYGSGVALTAQIYSKFTGMKVVYGSTSQGAGVRTNSRPPPRYTDLSTPSHEQITITGLNFGSVNYTPTTFFVNGDDEIAGGTTSWTSVTTVLLRNSGAAPFYPALADVAVQAAASFGTMLQVFSYDSPVLTDSKPCNVPNTEGSTITLLGLNFANSAPTPTLRVGETLCSTTSWSTSTVVTCSGSPGVGSAHTVRLTLTSAIGTNMKMFTFDGPAVTHMSYNAVGTQGSSVTIRGLNFATSTYTLTAVIGETQCGTSSWVSGSSIVCASAAGSGQQLLTSVTVASVSGTLQGQFTYDAPVVSFDKTPNLPGSSGSVLTLTGLNFGYLDSSATAGISGSLCSSTQWVSATSIACMTPSGTGKDLAIVMTVGMAVGTKMLTFTYDAPVTTALHSFNKPVTVGSSVTIVGTNFGASDATPTATIGSTGCATTVWTSETAVNCAHQPGVDGSHDVTLIINSQIATRSVAFTYDAPVITNIGERNGPTSSGTSVTISGTGFGSVDYTVTMQIGSSVCQTTAWFTQTKLNCVPPQTMGGSNLRAVATISSLTGTQLSAFTYDAPVISRVLAVNSPTTTGASITLEGYNFGTPGNPSPTVQIGTSTRCSSTSWVSTTSVTCRQGIYGTGKRRGVVLSLGGQSGTKSRVFSYDAPVVTGLGSFNVAGTYNAPTSSGASITMIGMNFGGNDFTLTARVGAATCPTVSWSAASVLLCLSPSSTAFLTTGGSRQTHVSADLHTLMGTLYEIFTYDAPVISSQSPNGPTLGGGDTTIEGLNFGVIDMSPTARLGASMCASTEWKSQTAVTCRQTAGYDRAHTVALTIGTLVGTISKSFTYDIAVITALKQHNSAVSGSTTLSVLGLNFATSDASATVRLGASICGTTAWTSSTQLKCTTLAGAGSKLSAAVTISMVVGTATSFFSYNAPVISVIDAVNAPNTAGTSITLHGMNFGFVNESPTAYLGSSICGTTNFVSDTSLICHQQWKGTGTGYSKQLTLSGLVGTKFQVFTFDAPVVTSASPTNMPSTATAFITLAGANFGDTYDISASITLGATACATASWASSTSLTCGGVQGTGGSLTMSVRVSDRYGTGLSMFTYDSPVVSQADVVYGNPSGGFSVTLSGANFGYSNFSPSALLGETVCTTSEWRSESSIICGGPPGFGNAVPVSVAVDDVMGSLQGTFTYAGPLVSFFSYQNGPTSGGVSISLQGENFGISDPTPTVVIGVSGPSNTQRCLTSSWYTVTSVVCASTASAGVSKTVQINVGDNVGTATNRFTYDQPIVTSLRQPNMPTSGMASITIIGVNFGNFDFTVSSRIGVTACGTVSWNAASTVVCHGNFYGDGLKQSLSVTVDNVVGTLSESFSFDAPVVTSMNRNNQPTSAGRDVTILGFEFSMFDKTPSVILGSTTCGSTTWTTQTAVRCDSPPGAGSAVNARVQHEDMAGTGYQLFSYDAPLLTRSYGYNGASTGGYTLTISGSNFGVSNLTPSVKIGKTTCRTTTWSSLTSLLCGTPPGYGGNLHTGAVVGSITGTFSISFTYDAPVVTQLSHFNMPSTSGASITIYGNQFGFEDTTPLPRIGSTRCATTSWNSETTLVCRSADGKNVGHSFALSVGMLVGTMTNYFSYDAPVLTFPARPNAPTSGSASLTLYGVNFGLSDISVTAEVGPTTCGSTSWTSATMLTCLSPVSGGRAYHSSVRSGGGVLIGTALSIFTYDSPIISILQYANGAASGTTSITLVGSNFVVIDLTPSAEIGSSVCETTTWTSGTNVKCHLRPGLSRSHTAVLTLSGLVGTSFRTFSYDTPALTYVHMFNLPLTGSHSVTINGFNFGMTDDYSPTIKFGSTYCSSSSWTASTALKCLSPPGTGIMQYMGLTLGSVVGTGSNLFSYDSPAISIVERNNSPSTAGTTVTMKGANFGSSKESGTATIGSTACEKTAYVSSTSLTCSVPAGAGSYLQATVEVSGNIGTRATTYSFDSPILTFVSRFNAPSSSGAQITLSGFNYGFEDFTPTAQIGSSACATTYWTSLTSIDCMSPTGQGNTLNSLLTIDSVIGTLPLSFSYDSPVISSARVFNAPTSTGMSVTVVGLNFAPHDFTHTTMIGGAACTTSSWSSSTMVQCLSSAHIGQGLPLEVIISGNLGSSAAIFTYDSPTFSQVAPYNSVSSGSIMITMRGLNFATTTVTQTVSIGETACSTTSWTSTTSTYCMLASGSGFRSVMSTIASHIGTGYMQFTYDTPVISGQQLGNAASTGSTSVTLTGLNFASMDNSVTARLGTFECASASWTTASSVLCQADSGNGHNLFVTVVVDEAGTGHAMFSYDAPIVSMVDRPNAPTSGHAHLTMHGLNFGAADRTPSSHLATTVCLTSVWSTDSSVVCTSPIGTGTQIAVVVSVSGVIGTRHVGFSYDSAVITDVMDRNGPATGGASVTIKGFNFGVPDASATVAVGITACSTTSWSAHTSISCLQNAGAGMIVNAAVTVTNNVGSRTGAFTFDTPAISAVHQYNAATTGQTIVTLLGSNFGMMDYSASGRIGLSACVTSVWTSDTQLLCTSSVGSAMMLHTALSVESLVGTHPLTLTYDSPVVTFVSRYNAPSTGTTSVTLSGTNFGGSKLPGSSDQLGHLGMTSCESNYWLSATSMICSVSDGVGALLNANVVLSSVTGTGLVAFTYDSPVVTFATRPNSAASGGATLTLRGQNFGATDYTSTVAIGASVCLTTTWRTDSTILCQVAPGIQPTLHAAVTVGSTVGTAHLAFSYDAPVATQIVTNNAPTAGGAIVTVYGFNFGAQDGSGTVSLGVSNCVSSVWVGNTMLQCLHPSGTGFGKTTRALVQSLAGTLSASFTFDGPVITFMTTQSNNAPTSASLSVTVQGFNFAMSNTSPIVHFGGKACETTSWQSDTSVVCNSVAGSGDARLSIVVDSVIGTGPSLFTYDGPVITDLARPNIAGTGGGSIMIAGTNFGPTDFSMSVKIGLTSCATVSWTSVTYAACLVAAGEGVRSVQLSLSGVVGTGLLVFSYDAPSVTFVAVTNNPTTGGGLVTIHGMNFGMTDYSSTTGVVPTECANTRWQSDTSVACEIPHGSGAQLSQTVTLSSLVGSYYLAFTYDSPAVTRLHVPNVPTTSGATVTLMGTNFGSGAAMNTVIIGETACSTTYWSATTAMVCASEPGVGAAYAVSLEVTNLIGTFFSSFSYDSPAVTMADPLNMPTTAGVSITLAGTNFGKFDSSFTMAIGGTTCQKTVWHSTTAVSCNPQVGSGGMVSAVVLGSATTSPIGADIAYGFSYDSPVLSYAGAVINGPTNGGTTLTLMGTNLGFFEPDIESKQAGVIAFSECAATQWVSNTELTCVVPQGIGTMRHIAVAYQKNIGTMPAIFTYDAPIVTHLNAGNAPTAGSGRLTINGLNLGAVSPFASDPMSTSAMMYPKNTSRAYVANDVYDAGVYQKTDYQPCKTTSFVSSSEIVCTTPEGTGAARSVQVSVEGVTVEYQNVKSSHTSGILEKGFSYDSPVLTFLNAANGPISSGASVTLSGQNFGNMNSGHQLFMSKDRSGPEAVTIQFISDTMLVASQPPYRPNDGLGSGVGKDLFMVLDAANNKVNTIQSVFEKPFSFDAPSITVSYPVNIPTTAGQIVTLNGHNFGLEDTAANLKAFIGQNECLKTVWVSDTTLTCTPSQGLGSAQALRADLNGNMGTFGAAFTYDAPVILGLIGAGLAAPQNGNLTFGITGTNLGINPEATRRSPIPPVIKPDQVIISVGDELCQTSTFISSTSLSCTGIVAGSNTPQRVSVTLGGNVNSFMYTFVNGVTCPNACYAKQGQGTCINGACQCSQVPGTERFYQGSDCSLDYCLSNTVETAAAGDITDHTEKTYFYKPWYQAGNKCSWLLQPQNGNAGMVTLQVKKVDIHPADSVIVYDGKDATATVLAVLTGQELPPKPDIMVRSTGGDMFVALSTQNTGSPVLRTGFTGFEASYTSSPAGCPLGCSAHLNLGKCVKDATTGVSQCECNDGWRGAGCDLGHAPLDEDFEAPISDDNWLDVKGGNYKSAVFQFGCGTSGAGSGKDNLFFNGRNQRYLLTRALNFEHGGYISFRLKIGSGSSDCEKVDEGEEIVLQWSTMENFTQNVNDLGKYSAQSFENFRLVQVPVPAMPVPANQIYLRWSQPKHDLIRDKDTWAIDDIRVATPFICPKGADGQMCSGRGSCSATNQCSCYDGFIGSYCGAACHWNYWHEKECGCPADYAA